DSYDQNGFRINRTGQAVDKIVELIVESFPAEAAHVVHQFVHENQTRLILGNQLSDDIATGGRSLLVVLFDEIERGGTAKLPRNPSPGCESFRLNTSPSAGNRIELCPDKNRPASLGNGLNLGFVPDLLNSNPFVRGGTGFRKMVEQG